MTSKNAPPPIKTNPNRTWPFGFHASFLKISEGPITSLCEIAFAAEASIAAFWLLRVMPPEPINTRKPTKMRKMPSTNVASVCDMKECEGKNQPSSKYVAEAIASEMPIKINAFSTRFLFMLLK